MVSRPPDIPMLQESDLIQILMAEPSTLQTQVPWDSVNRTVHTALGELRMKNNPVQNPGETKLDRFIKGHQFSTGEYFTVKNVDIGFGEALGRRLQEGTNHKRAFTTCHVQPLHDIHSYFNPDHQQTEDPSRRRSSTEEPDYERCAYDRHQLYSGYNQQLAREHEVRAMSRSSPGKRKRHSEQSSIPNSPELLLSDNKISPTNIHEIKDSADEDENEGKTISAKRVKPNAGKKVKQHSSEAVVVSHTEEQNANSKGEAREKDFYHSEQKKTLRWNAAERYQTKGSSAIPDFGDYKQQKTLAPAIGQFHRGQVMPAHIGGPKPINRLGGQHIATPAYNASATKPFNFTGSSGPSYYSNKRQKVGRDPLPTNAAAREVIELDGDPSHDWNNGKLSAAISRQSQSQHSHHKRDISREESGRVDEYCHVEHTMSVKNSRKKRRESSTDGQQHNGGGRRFKQIVIKHGDALGTEIEGDPIECEEVPPTKSNPMRKPKTIPQVEIPSFAPHATPYKGSAFREPTRPHANGRSSTESTASTARGPRESPHFLPNPAQQRYGSNGSNIANEVNPGRMEPPATREQTVNPGKRLKKKPNTTQECDESLDEISTDHYPSVDRRNYDQARELLDPRQQQVLASQKRAQSSTSMPANRSTHRQDFLVESSSDEERGRGNLPKTKFAEPNKIRQKNIPGQRYDVLSVFSETDKWLVRPSNDQWSLIHNINAKELILFSGEGEPQWGLSTVKIEKIQFHDGGSELVIHKARDLSTGGGTHIYLELLNADQCDALREKLKSEHKTIGLIPKSSEYLRRVFENISRQKPSQPKRKRHSTEEQPADIQLMAQNQEHRNSKVDGILDNALDRKKAGSGTGSESASAAPSKSIAKSMRTRSSSGLLEEEQERPFKHPPLPPAEFYSSYEQARGNPASSTRSSARVSGKELAPRQPARPPSPSPERWTTLNPGWAEDWQVSIVYPREGKSQAIVDKQDIGRLDEGEFLNDNLIAFYLRWLENRLEQRNPKFAKRVYFHNTFFYERLTKGAHGKKNIDYAAVRRWTSKVELLKYDYIIVPVNEHTHWYVAIICNAPKLLNPSPAVTDNPQSQENIDRFKDRAILPETSSKTPRLSPTPPSPARDLGLSSDPTVDTKMWGMSLEDRPPADPTHEEKLPVHSERADWADSDGQLLPTASGSRQPISLGGYDGLNEHVVENLHLVISDLQSPLAKKQAPTRKAKEKRKSFPRKYDLKEPRIITLDSLGLTHPPTCRNLKEYLVAEIKDKEGQDIPPPGAIGMTAKHIPLQTNYCDCGLFLLSYIEMFLDKGDDFIHGLLQNSEDLELNWPKASEMRANIRNLLFHLQEKQVVENERLQKEKGKGKRPQKAEQKGAAVLPQKPESREASKSARPSPERLVTEKGLAPAQKSSKGRPKWPAVEISTPALETAEASVPQVDTPPIMRPKTSSTMASTEIIDLDPNSQEFPVSQKEQIIESNGILDRVRSRFKGLVRGKSPSNPDRKMTDTTPPPSASSKANIIEVLESPTKQLQDDLFHNHASSYRSQNSEAKESSELRSQHHPARAEGGRTRSDAIELFEDHDLPENGSNRQECKCLRQHEDSTRLKSPSLELEDARPNARLRRATPYPHQSNPSPEPGQPTESQYIIDSDHDGDPVHFIPTEKTEGNRQITPHQESNNGEMLLPNGSEPALGGGLPGEPESLTESIPTPPNHRSGFSGLHRTQLPVAADHISPRRTKRPTTPSPSARRAFDNGVPNTEPPSSRKRKAADDFEGWSVLPSHKDLGGFRDTSDRSIIGSRITYFKGKHAKF